MATAPLLRVVVDTNVVFEGLTKQGSAAGLVIDAWLAGLLEACVSNALAYEYEDVLSRKLSARRWQTLQPVLGTLLHCSLFTVIYYSWRPTSPDAGDDLVIDCAMNAGAIVITSNLRDFQSARASLGLQVMTPVQLVIKLASGESQIMSRLTLRLPETLHQQLIHLAEGEGVSLNQYIVYTLTRQVSAAYAISAVPEEGINQQKQAFNTLLQALGQVSQTELEAALAKRETVQMDAELSPEIVAHLQQRIQNAAKA